MGRARRGPVGAIGLAGGRVQAIARPRRVVGTSRPRRVGDTIAATSRPVPAALWDELEALLPPESVWLDAPFDRRPFDR